MTPRVTIRPECPADEAAVRDVNVRAFERPVEAGTVDALRRSCEGCVSLVAEDDGMVVGHVMFSPVVLECGGRSLTGMGLAPLSVLPTRQGAGIGSALVERGIAELRERGCTFVIVLGHPGFYPRFGFERASAHGLSCQWGGVPDQAFMVLVLDAAAIDGMSGVVRYRDEFDAAV
jgi:putative acetyltransferase